MRNPIRLCPIHCNAFFGMNQIINNFEATVLLSRLQFHQANSRITKFGKIWIARTREQMGAWLDLSEKKVTTLLNHLETLGFIEKRVDFWYGVRRLFIHVVNPEDELKVNHRQLSHLASMTGSLVSALILSKISFALANTQIAMDGAPWCSLTRRDLAQWSGLSERSIDRILGMLVKQGLLIKRNTVWGRRRRLHFHIPSFVYNQFYETFNTEGNMKTKSIKRKSAEDPSGKTHVAKMDFSIKVNTKEKKASNNTGERLPTVANCNLTKSDINLNTLGHSLSRRQAAYLQGALQTTLDRSGQNVSDPKGLSDEIAFSVLNDSQHKGITGLQHRLSRCLKIVTDGNWRRPFGFLTHSTQGQNRLEAERGREADWQAVKLAPYALLAVKESNLVPKVEERPVAAGLNAATQKALAIVKQLKQLQHKHAQQRPVSSEIKVQVEQWEKALRDCLAQGADKKMVLDALSHSDNSGSNQRQALLQRTKEKENNDE